MINEQKNEHDLPNEKKVSNANESGLSNSCENENTDNVEYKSFSDDIDPIENSNDKNDNEQKRIKDLEEELAKTKELMLRSVAEAENRRKRALKEREDASKFAISSFSRDLINVADNLRRAIDSVSEELIEQHSQIKNLINGVLATERELLRSFSKHGIEKTDPLGEQFDPNFHEVMFETPTPDKESGIIIQVIEPGYIINGRVLRPARVGIAKNDSSGDGSKDTSPQPENSGHIVDTQA